MPLFKFGGLSDYVIGTGTLAVPAPVFLCTGTILGREGDVEFIVPAALFGLVGDANVNFAVPSPVFSARGNEQCDCEFLITIPLITASGHVSIEGIAALNIPTTKLVVFGENFAEFSIPSVNLAASGNVQVHGDGTFSVPATKLSSQAIISQFGDASIKITLPKFLANASASGVVGDISMVVPSLYFTARGAVTVEDTPATDFDVILKFERRRRLI